MLEIKQEPNRFYILDEQGDLVGELTFLFGKNNVIIADHTYVNSNYRGQGIASKLVEQFIAWVMKNEYTVKPVCSYVEKIFKDTPKYHHIWNQE